jgi:hypothetical protein
MEGAWRFIVDLLATVAAIVVILTYFNVTPASWKTTFSSGKKRTLIAMLILMALSLGMSGYALYKSLRPRIVEKAIDRPVERVVEKIVPQECPKCQAATYVTSKGRNSGAVGTVQQGPCSSLNVGGSQNESTINCPPPLILTATTLSTSSDATGSILTKIRIVPNVAVPAPFQIELDFDNPVSSMGCWVENTASMTMGGPFRNGVHAMTTVNNGINPAHPLLVTVASEKPVKLIGPPRID